MSDKNTKEIGWKMAKSTGWTIATRLSVQTIGFFSTLILARLLLPQDFGLVALATTFSAALMTTTAFSFDVVLIQNQQAGRAEYDSVWTLSICRNTVLAIALAFLAKPSASFFGDSRIEGVLYCIAVVAFVDGFENIGIVDFRKYLAFHKDMLFMVAGKVGTFAVTVPLAFLWRDYRALMAGLVAASVVRVAASYAMHEYRPHLTLACWREIMNFSKWLLLNNICTFLYHRSDTLVIGRIAGASFVGVYGMAYELTQLATSNLVAPLRRAIFPAYAKVSEDRAHLRDCFIDVFALVMLLGTPVALGIGLVAAPLVMTLLGPQWINCIPVIRILSVYGFLGVASAGTGPIFLAAAKPHYLSWIFGGTSLIMLPLLIIGVRYAGPLGAAWVVTLTALLAVIADFWLAVRLLSLPITRLLTTGWRPTVAVAVLAITEIGLQWYWPAPGDFGDWATMLAVAISFGCIVYPAVVMLLWRVAGRPEGAEQKVLAAIRAVALVILKFKTKGRQFHRGAAG